MQECLNITMNKALRMCHLQLVLFYSCIEAFNHSRIYEVVV